MARQRFLYDDKYRFEFVLDETVLTRRVAPAEVMYAQVDRILGFMDRPNLRLGILPIHGDFHDVVRNSFELYGTIGVVETYYDDATMEPGAWSAHVAAMQNIWQDAVEGDEARKLIRNAMNYHARGMTKRRGRKTYGRVRIVETPPTDYQRWMQWMDRWNREAGEDILYLTRQGARDAGIIPQIGPDDWWLFDDSRLVVMRHDEFGRRIEAEMYEDESEVGQARQWRERAIRAAAEEAQRSVSEDD
jgi:hypothetical protein